MTFVAFAIAADTDLPRRIGLMIGSGTRAKIIRVSTDNFSQHFPRTRDTQKYLHELQVMPQTSVVRLYR